MAKFFEFADVSQEVVLTPQVARAFWSQRRAWVGDDLTLTVETKYVPNGSKFTVEVWEDDSGEGGGDDFVAEVEGSHTIEGNRCRIDWKLDFDSEALSDEIATEGGVLEFYFNVKFDSPEIQGRSGLLLVDMSSFEPGA